MFEDKETVTYTRNGEAYAITTSHGLGAMIGEPITDSQRKTIDRICKNIKTPFRGVDKYDAYRYINQYMSESMRIEEEQRAIEVKKHKEDRKNNPEFYCSCCGKDIFGFIVFHDITIDSPDNKLCHSCYEEKLKTPEWFSARANLMKAMDDANTTVTKEKPAGEICSCCGTPVDKDNSYCDITNDSPDNKLCDNCFDKKSRTPEWKAVIDRAMGSAKRGRKTVEKPTKKCSCCGVPVSNDFAYHDITNPGSNNELCDDCYKKKCQTSEWKKIDKGIKDRMKMGGKKVGRKPVETKPEKKRGNHMLNNIKSLLGEFGKVTTEQFKLSFQGIAVRTEKPTTENAASYAVYDAANNRMVDVMDFVLDAQGLLFKIPVTISQLKQGDIIIVKEKPLVVKSVNAEAQSIRALNPLSNNETTHKPAGNLFGFQFITKVTSMFELTQGGQQAMNPLMMMAFMGDDEGDNKFADLLPLMMMGGFQGTGANPMAQMLPLMMMSGGKDGKNSSIMETMLMAQMFGGFGGGFGAPAQAQPVQQPTQGQGFGNFFGQGFPMFGATPFAPVTSVPVDEKPEGSTEE